MEEGRFFSGMFVGVRIIRLLDLSLPLRREEDKS
jgi:hypothetical protein